MFVSDLLTGGAVLFTVCLLIAVCAYWWYEYFTGKSIVKEHWEREQTQAIPPLQDDHTVPMSLHNEATMPIHTEQVHTETAEETREWNDWWGRKADEWRDDNTVPIQWRQNW